MRAGAAVLSLLLLVETMPVRAAAQAGEGQLNLVIVEGEGAINNIKQRTAREPIVQVEDENHKPVAGAAVVFLLPDQGAGGTFAGGTHMLTVTSDAQGRAIAHGFHPNGVQGNFQMKVTASFQGKTANASISQTNAAGAAAGAAAAGLSVKWIVIIAVAGAAAAGAAVAATHSGGSSSTTTTTPPPVITITPGTGTVGAPH